MDSYFGWQPQNTWIMYITENIIMMGLISSLTTVLWVFSGILIYCAALATYVIVFEQRRRKRTDSADDDWR